MDGIISRVSAEQFESVQVGQQIVNIHNIDSVEVLIQLPDRLYATQPTAGELAKIETVVRVPSGQVYPARIKEFTLSQTLPRGHLLSPFLCPCQSKN